MLHFRRIATIVVTLVLALSTFALMTNVSAGKGGRYSGSTSATPNPALATQSVWVSCSWNAYRKAGLFWATVYCKVDGVVWSSSYNPSGTAGTTFAAGSLSAGSHILEVDYATGMTRCNGAPCYKWAKTTATLTITPCYTDTITFHVYQEHSTRLVGSAASITFNGKTYVDSTPTNPQTATVTGGCGLAYQIQANTNANWPFFQWVTTTDGTFDSPSASSTYFRPGSWSGIISLIVWNYAAPDGPFVSGYTGYAASVNQASAIFTIPSTASLSYVLTLAPGLNPNFLNIGVGLGGVNGPRQTEAGVTVILPQPGTQVLVCGDNHCYTVTSLMMCAYAFYNDVTLSPATPHYQYYCNELPGISGGHQVYVWLNYESFTHTSSFSIQDQTTGFGVGGNVGASYTPDLTTAEWGVFTMAHGSPEGFYGDFYAKPTFGPIQFSFMGSSAHWNLAAGSMLNTYGVLGYRVAPDYLWRQLATSPGVLAQRDPNSFTVVYSLW